MSEQLKKLDAALSTMTRDVEVTIRVKVRPYREEPSGPLVTEALLQLLEDPRFRFGAHVNGEVFVCSGHYVQVSFSNDYRVHGVVEQIERYQVKP